MGLPSLIVFAVTGLAWGAMPVNPARFRGRFDDAIVAAAGPMMNVLIAIVCLAGAIVTELVTHDRKSALWIIFLLGLSLNLALAMLNLIPVPPLDGSRIAASFIPPLKQVVYNPQAALLGIIVLVVISRVGGVGILDVAVNAAFKAIESGVRTFSRI
jgi:Zn-dependent protease